MTLRATVAVVAVAATAGLIGPGTAAAAAGWQQHELAIPEGYYGAYFSVTTTDGKGNYAGNVDIVDQDTESDLVLWQGGHATVVRNPVQCTEVHASDQNPAGLIAVSGTGCVYHDAAAFTYGTGGFHELTPPEGYNQASAIAVNPSGDVLGRVWDSFTGDPDATALWHHDGSAPVVIPDTVAGQQPVDLDDDGTVLFQTETGGALWRGGTLTALSLPAVSTAGVHAIKHGVVVGSVSQGAKQSAYWWPTPTTPTALPGAETATDINASGLIVGGVTTWRDGVPAGTLPNYGEGLSGAEAVGDDGTVVGYDNPDYRTAIPVTWTDTTRR